MYKQFTSQANTKQLRKTKLLQSYRQPQPSHTSPYTLPTTNRTKIMLTDLCPQQKSKIGQLVRTLQARKCQNQKLQEKVIQNGKKQKKYIEKIQQLQRIIEEFKVKQGKFREQLTLCKIKQQQRQKYIEHLSIQKQQQLKQLSKNKKLPLVDQYALTDKIYVIEQGVQVNQKKKKYKDREIQTENSIQFQGKVRGRQRQRQREKQGADGRKYPTSNSRSFQKIMRDSQGRRDINNSRGRQAENQIDNRNRNRSNRIKSSGNSQRQNNKIKRKHKKSDIIINDQQNQENQEQLDKEDVNNSQNEDDNNEDQQNQQQIQDDDNDDDDFNELAKKWLELKQRNMTKIKQSYDKSQQKIKSAHSHDKNTKSSKKPIGSSKTVGLPRQFNYNEKNIVEQEHEGSHLSSQGYLENNQSFGPQQPSLRQSKKKYGGGARDKPSATELLDENFDQIQLNRRLKQKNFSASSILRKNNPSIRQLSQQSQRQYRKQDLTKPDNSNNDKKLKISKNSQIISTPHLQQNTPNMKMSSASNNSRSHYGHNIDFYETDLLDIVSAINQK